MSLPAGHLPKHTSSMGTGTGGRDKIHIEGDENKNDSLVIENCIRK